MKNNNMHFLPVEYAGSLSRFSIVCKKLIPPILPFFVTNPLCNMKLFSYILFFMCMSLTATATTFTVSNFNDAGAGSLRQAITDANTDFSATPGAPHSINFTVSGTHFINSVLPVINNHMTLNGHAAGSTVTRGNLVSFYRIFEVKAFTVEMNNIKVETGNPGGSNPGGGILNDGGILTMINCIVQGNECGALVGGHGGGIAQNSGTMTINNSTIKNNDSGGNGLGGGVYIADGTVTLTNCTVQNNSTGGNNGGAIFVDLSSILNLINCTVIDNVSGHNTGFSSGGVFYGNNAQLNMTNTILANNKHFSGASLSDFRVIGPGSSTDISRRGACKCPIIYSDRTQVWSVNILPSADSQTAQIRI